MINSITRILFFAIMLQFSSIFSQSKEMNYFYQSAGIIKIFDKESSMVGYRNYGDEVFYLTLKDVGNYTGEVCVGVSSGYILTKKALELLYPNDEIPMRGNISIAVSSYSDHAEVASYITKAKPIEIVGNNDAYIVKDSTIQTPKKSVVLIFKRNDTDKMVKATFNKSKLVSDDKEKEMKKLKMKVIKGEASDEEKELFAEKVQSFVKIIVENIPDGVITVEECINYRFP